MRAVVTAAGHHLRAPATQLDGLIEVSELEMEPAQAIEQPAVVDQLVADPLGQGHALLEQSEGPRVLGLPGQRQAVEEEAEEERDQVIVLPGELQRFGLELRGPRVVSLPVPEVPGHRQGE